MSGTRRALLVGAKSLLAAALLVWVLAQVHWHDYVTDAASGRTFAVLEQRTHDGRCELRLEEGALWWRTQSLQPCERFTPKLAGAPLTSPGVAASLRGLRFGFVAAAVATHLLFLLLLSARWLLLLRTAAIPMSLWEATRLNFLGVFFNTFMPGSVGGDVIKAYYAAQRTPNKAAAVVSIVLDRLLGLLGFALLAAIVCCVAVALGASDVGHLQKAVLSSALLTIGVAGGLSVLLSTRLRRIVGLGPLSRWLRLTRYTESLSEAARLFEHRLLRLAWPGALALLATIVMVSSFALVGLALGLQTSWYSYYLYVPLIMIISAVPLTPGGLGVLEQLYLFYFVSEACWPSQILAFVLLLRVLTMLCSLPGSLVLIAGSAAPTPSQVGTTLGSSRTTA
jgi:uncharacterized protein (TIRG00374 family)